MVLPKWFSGFLLHITRSAATAVVIAAAVALWASLKIYAEATQLGLPVAIAGGVLVFGAVATAWNSLQQIDDRNARRRQANRSPAEIERWIWDWLRTQRYTVQDAPSPDHDFQIAVTSETGQKLGIYKRKDRPWVGITATRSPDPLDEKTKAMQADRNSAFRTDLTIELAQIGVAFRIDGQGIVVLRPLTFDDSITELTFLQEVGLVERALNIVDGIWSRHTSLNPPTTPQLPPASKRDP
jgi:hypothetical protein